MPPKPLSTPTTPYPLTTTVPLRGFLFLQALRIVSACVLAVIVTSCSRDLLSAKAIRPAVDLVTRDYEVYVSKDVSLSELDRDAKAQTSRMLRDVVRCAAEGFNDDRH